MCFFLDFIKSIFFCFDFARCTRCTKRQIAILFFPFCVCTFLHSFAFTAPLLLTVCIRMQYTRAQRTKEWLWETRREKNRIHVHVQTAESASGLSNHSHTLEINSTLLFIAFWHFAGGATTFIFTYGKYEICARVCVSKRMSKHRRIAPNVWEITNAQSVWTRNERRKKWRHSRPFDIYAATIHEIFGSWWNYQHNLVSIS